MAISSTRHVIFYFLSFLCCTLHGLQISLYEYGLGEKEKVSKQLVANEDMVVFRSQVDYSDDIEAKFVYFQTFKESVPGYNYLCHIDLRTQCKKGGYTPAVCLCSIITEHVVEINVSVTATISLNGALLRGTVIRSYDNKKFVSEKQAFPEMFEKHKTDTIKVFLQILGVFFLTVVIFKASRSRRVLKTASKNKMDLEDISKKVNEKDKGHQLWERKIASIKQKHLAEKEKLLYILEKIQCKRRKHQDCLRDYFSKILNEEHISDLKGLRQVLHDELNKSDDDKMQDLVEMKKKYMKILSVAEQEQVTSSSIINDPIHGHIQLHPACQLIVETPQFQRLRFIKQLGTLFFVFPGTSQSIFEHALGVCHLAGQFSRALHKNQPHLGITEMDILCVEIGGLCFSLGQCPFSGQYVDTFLHGSENKKKRKLASAMLDYLLEDNNLRDKLKIHGIEEQDITFIKEQISGPISTGTTAWPYKGRTEKKAFLYEIVNNLRNGIDVHKWDFMARACYQLGIQNNFAFSRYIKYARVIEEDGEMQICIRDTETGNLFNMVYTNYKLNKYAYQHIINCAIGVMLTRAFKKAKKYVTFEGASERFVLSRCHEDMMAYSRLTDNVLVKILDAPISKDNTKEKENLQEAKNCIQRIIDGDTYTCVFESKPITHKSLTRICNADTLKMSGQKSNSPFQIPKDTGKKEETDESKIKKKILSHLEGVENEDFKKSVIVVINYLDFGNDEIIIIQRLKVYSKRNINMAWPLSREQELIINSPEWPNELLVRVYCTTKSREDCESLGNAAEKVFTIDKKTSKSQDEKKKPQITEDKIKQSYSTGTHKTWVPDERDSSLYKHYNSCEKNPGHKKFIPVCDFNINHLPEEYLDNSLVDYIKATADLTVRVDVKSVSTKRPQFWPNTEQPYPFYNMRGSNVLRLGTGMILNVYKWTEKNNKGTCKCQKCKQSDNPSKVWGEVIMTTATLVVFDDYEARHTMCRLFYDRPDCPLVTLDGWVVVKADIQEELCELTSMTCDVALLDKLEKMVRNWYDLWKKVFNKYTRSRDEHKLTIIVSHPHGCTKQVSVGQWINRFVIGDGKTKYTYTTCTCAGSSGAFVHSLGYNGCKYDPHVHSGVNPEGINFSGTGRDWV